MRRIFIAMTLCAAAAASTAPAASAQDSLLGADALATDSGRFRLKVEMKVNARTSSALEFPVGNTGAPFPVLLATVSPHTSAELSNIALTAEGDVTSGILARVVVHFLDLYNRNPTSSAERVTVREAFVRFGKKWESLKEMPGTTAYLELGKAPRFSKQIARKLESYGLWGTAVSRFEETGAEAGGSFGPHVYWRASATGGTPLFFRDVNALAGDNGTPRAHDRLDDAHRLRLGFSDPLRHDGDRHRPFGPLSARRRRGPALQLGREPKGRHRPSRLVLPA